MFFCFVFFPLSFCIFNLIVTSIIYVYLISNNDGPTHLIICLMLQKKKEKGKRKNEKKKKRRGGGFGKVSLVQYLITFVSFLLFCSGKFSEELTTKQTA